MSTSSFWWAASTSGAAAEAGGAAPGRQAAAGSEEWRRFTPAEINRQFCLARTWDSGRGGQCARKPPPGSEFCATHGSEQGRSHGRVDGPIPAAKLLAFKKEASGGRAAAIAGSTAGRAAPVRASLGAPAPAKQARLKVTARSKRAAAVASARAVGITDDNFGVAKRAKTAQERWLAAGGTALTTKPAPVPGERETAWSLEQVWEEALGERAPKPTPPSIPISGSLADANQIWADMAETALLRLPETWLRGDGQASEGSLVVQTSEQVAPMQISSEAVTLLGEWMERWLTDLLAELHRLSLHRVSSLDEARDTPGQPKLPRLELLCPRATGGLTVGRQAPAASIPRLGGWTRTYDFSLRTALQMQPATGDGAETEQSWSEALRQRQRLRRIGLADLRAAANLGFRASGARDNFLPMPCCLKWHRLLPLVDEKELGE
ncbi:unnamed protein product [Polarella glacialis]|uniref:Uncharacterized protein n=1 Tax=Polarella glacialis TaxID=89957 RepID=A0A813K954_POLGL|nr:unnamed protein product [Polarella glacialis]